MLKHALDSHVSIAMASRHRRRCPAALTFFIATSLTRSSLSFAPPLLANRAAAAEPTCGTRSRASWVCLNPGCSAPSLRAAATPNDGDAVDSGNIDDLVGIDEFRAEKAERDREEARSVAPPPAAAGASSEKGADLGLGGAIFPSDAFPGSPGTDGITLQGIRLEDGQPQAIIGFWQVCAWVGVGAHIHVGGTAVEMMVTFERLPRRTDYDNSTDAQNVCGCDGGTRAFPIA